ncbi:Opi1-domain-containing protein [Phaeosphaeriaceae sp. SRC1lsM3a]|nr:Opi1-domain-containing protein [Stagonospora sp. SRC1lsM3a]
MQQEQQQQRPPPPAYAQHEPESFHLPSVPTHLPQTPLSNGRLPGIKSLDLPDATRSARHTPHNSIELPALHSATFPRVPEALPRLPEDIGSPMDTASVWSAQDEKARRETSVSMDDPDVRLAAEALSGLGNPDFVRSPTARSLTLSARSPTAEPEPLLSLLTSNHPWLGGTINGSISAYNTTKGYTPRFVQYGAELIERNIGSPMVNTVSSVGRRTGMENNIRRYLGEQGRRPSDLEAGDDESSRKRQRRASPVGDAMDVDDAQAASRTRATSRSSYAESLPAYDDQRSPNYEEAVIAQPTTNGKEAEHRQQQDRRVAWSTQLIMTTSGLGVALSDSSLRSLKICLGLLRSSTTRIDTIMKSLKLVLEEYEAALKSRRNGDIEAPADDKYELNGTMAQMGLVDTDQDAQVRIIADKIKSLSSEIWTTLQSVVQSVSRYTGGALPQNASQVVRTQLLSVPQRWQLAGRQADGNDAATAEQGAQGEAVRGANRMLAFAKEGLDMMGQITTVVDGTVQSAETWLNRIGRRAAPSNGHTAANGDREKTPYALPNGTMGEKR